MEGEVLPSPRVRELIKDTGRVALYIQRENAEEIAHKKLMEKSYNNSGAIPAFFVIGADGEIKSHQIGSCSEDTFVEFLKAGGL